MKIAVFSSKPYDKEYMTLENEGLGHEITYFETPLRAHTAGLAEGFDDVYEEEGNLFFEDISSKILDDDVFARLLTFPNVLITGHQAFFTREALRNIAHTTLSNFSEIEQGSTCSNQVTSNLRKP